MTLKCTHRYLCPNTIKIKDLIAARKPGCFQLLSVSFMCVLIIDIDCGHRSTDGVLCDYTDDRHCASHSLNAVDEKFLQILYYDDVEVCNPIGSKRVIHKLGEFLLYM